VRSLWRQPEDAGGYGFRITEALDPAAYQLDPVSILQPA